MSYAHGPAFPCASIRSFYCGRFRSKLHVSALKHLSSRVLRVASTKCLLICAAIAFWNARQDNWMLCAQPKPLSITCRIHTITALVPVLGKPSTTSGRGSSRDRLTMPWCLSRHSSFNRRTTCCRTSSRFSFGFLGPGKSAERSCTSPDLVELS